MPLQDTDFFIVERADVQYRMTADQLQTFLRAGSLVADLAERDALTPLPGQRVYVTDATADPEVDAGGALYVWNGTEFRGVAADESFDVVVAPTDLSYTPGATQGTVNSGTGTSAIIPAVTDTNAGLATPQMLVDSHPAATTAGTTASNPVAIDAAQQISFSISGLAPLP